MPYLLFSGRKLKFTHGFGKGVEACTNTVTAELDKSKVLRIDNADPQVFLSQYGHPLVTHDSKNFWMQIPVQIQSGRRKEIRDIIPDESGFKIASDSSFGALPENDVRLCLTRCTADSVKRSAEGSIKPAVKQAENFQPAALLMFSCITRLYVLRKEGRDIQQEYHSVSGADLPANVPFLLFYCFGEIGPRKANANSSFNSSSIVSLVIGTSKTKAEKNTQELHKNADDFAALSWHLLYKNLRNKMKKEEIVTLIQKDFEKLFKKYGHEGISEEAINNYITSLESYRHYDNRLAEEYVKKVVKHRSGKKSR